MMTRLVLYSTLGLLCSSLGFTWDSKEFWCFIGLFTCVQHVAYLDGYDVALDHALAVFNKQKKEQND